MLQLNTDIIDYLSDFILQGQNGILNCISKKYKNKKLKILLEKIIIDSNLTKWYCKTYNFNLKNINCNWAAKKGYLNCLKYTININKKLVSSRTCTWAAHFGNLNCLEYLYNLKVKGDLWTGFKCAQYDNLECLEFLYRNKCPMDKYTCFKAAQFGNLNCLIFLLNIINLNYINLNLLKNIAYKNKKYNISNYLKLNYS